MLKVGTTGDTGSAAIEAVTGLKNVDIIVLYPKGMVSPVQELQMRSATGSNVHLILGEGTSDDLDVPIEKSFPAPNLTSINSLNWARVMIQVFKPLFIAAMRCVKNSRILIFRFLISSICI